MRMMRPDILFPAYVSGFNLAESFYLAMPYLSWQTVVVGDPLCAPFPRRPLPVSEIDGGIESGTELPAFFTERRLRLLVAQGTKPEAAKAAMRAEARTAKGDSRRREQGARGGDGARPEAGGRRTWCSPRRTKRRRLRQGDRSLPDGPRAAPDNVFALNNLAYSLAVRKGLAARRAAYAERAMTLSARKVRRWRTRWRGSSTCWAATSKPRGSWTAAVKASPHRAEIRLHAAVVFAAVGQAR